MKKIISFIIFLIPFLSDAQIQITPNTPLTGSMLGQVVINYRRAGTDSIYTAIKYTDMDTIWSFRYMLSNTKTVWDSVKNTPSTISGYGINNAYTKTETDGFLAAKLNIVDTTNKWKPIGYSPTSSEITSGLGFTPYNSSNPAGYITSAAISGKLNVSDTATMLNPYLRSSVAAATYQPIGSYATTTQLNGKVNISDTSSMLSGYQRAGSYATTTQLNGKVNISDTASMLSGYQRSGSYATTTQLATKLNISDTSSMLSGYQRSGSYATTTQLAAKVNIADTASMLSNYLRSASLNSSLIVSALGFTPIDLSGARNSISLTTTGTSGAATYNSSTGVLNIPNYAPGSGTVTSVAMSSTDFSVSGSPITTSGTLIANLNTTGVSAGSYTAGFTVDSKGRITAALNRSVNSSPNRSLSTTGSNNTFTVSSTRWSYVTYTINFAVALTLITSNGIVSLDYSLDGGTNWITVSSVSNAYTVAVTLAGNWDNVLAGWIPPNALVRIYRSTATNVTATAPTTKQQELLD